jgi:putative ABC transport system permease protein
MPILKQVRAGIGMNVLSIPNRLGSSFVMVIGIAGVVAVLISVLTVANGLSSVLLASGRSDRAIVIANGAIAEATSALPLNSASIISAAPSVVKTADGMAELSEDMLSAINVHRRSDGALGALTVRGVSRFSFLVRPEIRLVSGRRFTPGLHELIVGSDAQGRFKELDVGQRIDVAGDKWTVVGIFASDNAHESELLTDMTTLMSAYNRNWINSVTVLLRAPEEFDQFRNFLAHNPVLNVDVYPERVYYQQLANSTTGLMTLVTYVVSSVMALGAMFAALNTMYSAVSYRRTEIATLRAIGFGATSVSVSVLAEALCLAVVGALLGAAVPVLLFSGAMTSLGGLSGSVVAHFRMTPKLLVTGIVWACVVGFLGALLPAVRAARLPVAAALRAQ